MGAAHKLDVALRDVGAIPVARRMGYETFTAYGIRSSDGICGKKGEAVLHDRYDGFAPERHTTDSFDDFQSAINHGAYHSSHKDTFFVRRENVDTGKVTLHFFTVKRSSTARTVWDGHVSSRINPLYAEATHDLVLDAALMPARTSQEQPQ